MAHTDIPNAIQKIETRDKDVPWYNPSLDQKLAASTRELLETYSKIPADQVENHVYKIVLLSLFLMLRRTNESQRDEAWQIWPYPCIGGFRFLDLAIALSPEYPQIL